MSYQKIAGFVHLITHSIERKKVDIEFIFTAGGSWFEDDQDRGKKHLMEHCIASRTKDLDFQEFQDYQFKENIAVNAYTGPTTMGLEATGHVEDLEKMLDLMLEMSFLPTFDQMILDQEKEIVLREISERRGDPNYRLHYDVMNQIFEPNSYETHETLGDKDLVAQTTLADFNKLITQNLTNSNLIIGISGGGKELDLELINSKLKAILSQKSELTISQILNPKDKLALDFEIPTKFKEFSNKAVIHDLAHAHVELNLYVPIPINFSNKPALKIFEELFFKFYGKVYDRLRNELGLIYAMHSSFQVNLQHLYINLACEIKHLQIIVGEVELVFSDFNKYFDENKFQQFKNILRKKIDLTKDVSGSEFEYTKTSLTNFNEIENLDGFLSRLQKVTKEDIKEIYNLISKGLKSKKIIAVSNQKEVSKIVKEIN